MTKAQFEAQVVVLMDTLYRVSRSLLWRKQDQLDAVQNCLLRAWQNKDKLRDEDRFRPWLLRILVNECHTLCRTNRRIVYVEEINGVVEMSEPTLLDEIQELPEKIRIPFVLHYIEGFSVQEAAHVLSIPIGTVKTRLRKGRELLKNMIGEGV